MEPTECRGNCSCHPLLPCGLNEGAPCCCLFDQLYSHIIFFKAIARVTISAKAALDAERTTARAVSLKRRTTAARICAMEG